MKKSMLLSFVTAGAIIATSVGTYAAWDTLEAESTANISFRNPATVTATSLTKDTTKSNEDLGQDPKYVGTATFTLKDIPSTATTEGYSIKYTVEVKQGDAVVDPSKYDAIVTDPDQADLADGAHTATVTITPKDTSLVGSLGVTVTGTVEK